ncbi:MAG: nucleoside hydrolase, partial [Anaerolineae bacterium]|nr:nucleoside hydrolase [Anaerolineae bacterium]
MLRLVIDTDAGVDDAQAMMLALAHPDVQVEAITTVTGNTH